MNIRSTNHKNLGKVYRGSSYIRGVKLQTWMTAVLQVLDVSLLRVRVRGYGLRMF